MRIIFLIFFLSILTVACSNKGYQKIITNKIPDVNIFTGDFRKVIYKSDFEIYGNSISGISILKRSDNSIRMVSMSELGIKYFDIEFFPNESIEPKVHYMMDLMNRKMLVNRLKFDLGLLFNYPSLHSSLYQKRSDTKIKSGSYTYDCNNEKVDIISKSNLFGSKRIITFVYSDQTHPERISIRRSNILLVFEEIENFGISNP